MVEEQEVLPDTYIKFISPVADLKDKRNDQGWTDGYVSISTLKITLTPEINGEPAVDQATCINIADTNDVDKRIDLWKKVLGASKILPIHHMQDDNETVSLISTSNENYMLIKKLLFILVMNGSDIEYVCPFSQGGKIFLETKPVGGKIYIDENELILSSEWLGKQHTETIDIEKLNDFDKGEDGGVAKGMSSLTVKYQREGVVTSTLITGENKVTRCLDKYIKVIKGVSEEDDEEMDLSDQHFMLIQMMYTSDINSEMAMEMLGVSEEELGKIVQELVGFKILRTSGDEEVELTEKGTKYIVAKMKKNL